MKLSELIAHVGDDRVSFQNLAESLARVTKGKRDARVTFYTSTAQGDALMREAAGVGPSPLVALVVWLPRERLPDFKASETPPVEDPAPIGVEQPVRRYEAFDAAGFRWEDRTSYRQGAKDPKPDMWETKAGRLKISIGVRPDGWFLWCRTLNIDRAALITETPRQAATAAIAAIRDLLISDLEELRQNEKDEHRA